MSKPSIHEMGVGDVAYGIAVQAIEGKWDAAKLGPYIARFAIDYAAEVGLTGYELAGCADRAGVVIVLMEGDRIKGARFPMAADHERFAKEVNKAIAGQPSSK